MIKLHAKYSSLLVFTITIYWSSTRNICCYSIFYFCWYNVHNSYNFITLNHWSISNIFKKIAILTNTCPKIAIVIFFALTITFSFIDIIDIIIIAFVIYIACWTIEFGFKITSNMLCHCLNLFSLLTC